ncbi:MAG: replication protein [Candidatus Zixiibacteriota bacterium]
MKDKNGRFIGFYSPKYTQVPDDLFDELMSELSGSELKVLLYVVRRTFGWKKDSDKISLSQMANGITKKDGTMLDSGTGLSKQAVSRAVRSLVSREILIRRRNRSEKNSFEPTEYSLNISDYPLSNNVTRGGSQKMQQRVGHKCDIQETVKQDTEKTLSKPVDNSQTLQDKELLGQIMVTCRDPNSFNFYRKVVKEVPRFKVLSALSQVKEAQALGRVRKNAGAMFTDLIKLY